MQTSVAFLPDLLLTRCYACVAICRLPTDSCRNWYKLVNCSFALQDDLFSDCKIMERRNCGCEAREEADATEGRGMDQNSLLAR